MGYFKDVTPESAGISSKGILNFLDRIEENQIELHSFMVIRHGQCAAKGWWKPYDEKFRHSSYPIENHTTIRTETFGLKISGKGDANVQ